MKYLEIYTDGAYASSTDSGGVGIIILQNDKKVLEYSNGFKHTTNNRMELTAVIIALRIIKKRVDKLTIYSDSMYVIGGASLGWKRNKNLDLWQKFDNEMQRLSKLNFEIEFKHVKGHNKDKWNEKTDELAVFGSKLIL
jgi:ribonuclease HI